MKKHDTNQARTSWNGLTDTHSFNRNKTDILETSVVIRAVIGGRVGTVRP